MQINFFQEYHSERSLFKLKLINYSVKLYLGSANIRNFLKVKNSIEKNYKQVKQIIYWPLLNISEGYWLSAFAKTEAIQRVIKEIKYTKESFPVLWDAELPTLNKKLFITESFKIFSNKKLIYKALLNQNPKHPLVVAQFPKSGIKELFAQIGGVAFPFDNYHRLDMLYTSMMKVNNKKEDLKKIIRKHKKKYTNYSVGYGVIGKLDPSELERDLKIAKEEGIEEVVVYRLDGLDNNYLKVIKKYLS